MRKLTYEYVRDYFSEQGCELLETEYKNCMTKMRYRCKCGNISKISFLEPPLPQGKRIPNSTRQLK